MRGSSAAHRRPLMGGLPAIFGMQGGYHWLVPPSIPLSVVDRHPGHWVAYAASWQKGNSRRDCIAPYD